MNKDQREFQRLTIEILNLFIRKSKDYENNWKIGGPEGVEWQIFRKFIRLWQNRNNENINNESFRDTLIDLAVYSIMRTILLDRGIKTDQLKELLEK